MEWVVVICVEVSYVCIRVQTEMKIPPNDFLYFLIPMGYINRPGAIGAGAVGNALIF
jgi:hypothetical protein